MEKITGIERATQDELRADLKSLFQGAIRLTLEMVLEEELKAMVGARRFERVGSRKDRRNGTYLRRMLTSLGQIELQVPRSRENGAPADVLGRYRRRTEDVVQGHGVLRGWGTHSFTTPPVPGVSRAVVPKARRPRPDEPGKVV